MKVTITSLELKHPLKFFALSKNALQIVKQLRATDCKEFKKRGIWTKHYTMTLWNNEEELKQFARSGAHLEAMHNAAKIACAIKTLTVEADALPSWKGAKALLDQTQAIVYN